MARLKVVLRGLQEAFVTGECDDWLILYDADIQSAVATLVRQGADTVELTVKKVR